jgi:thiamine phosphate synthase YjbQ (UPF0047 family)
LSIPVDNGALALGTWQQIILLDFRQSATHPRNRGSIHRRD